MIKPERLPQVPFWSVDNDYIVQVLDTVESIQVVEDSDDTLNWKRVEAYSFVQETRYIRHVRLEHPVTIKIQGKKSIGVIN